MVNFRSNAHPSEHGNLTIRTNAYFVFCRASACSPIRANAHNAIRTNEYPMIRANACTKF